MTRSYSSGSVPLPDLGLVDVERISLHPFRPRCRKVHPLCLPSSTQEGCSSLALVTGLLNFLLLPL